MDHSAVAVSVLHECWVSLDQRNVPCSQEQALPDTGRRPGPTSVATLAVSSEVVEAFLTQCSALQQAADLLANFQKPTCQTEQIQLAEELLNKVTALEALVQEAWLVSPLRTFSARKLCVRHSTCLQLA